MRPESLKVRGMSKFILCLIVTFTFATNLIVMETSEASEPVIIGMLHGENFMFATMMKNSHEMALESINKGGGIKGRPIKLVYGDDQGKPKVGEKIVKELIKKTRAVMLVGGHASSNTLDMARMAERLDRPFLVSTAADDRITQRKWKNIYRMNPPASGYTRGLEEFFTKIITPSSMAIVYENSPYGTSGALRMMWFSRENDIDIRDIIPYHKERLRADYFQRLLVPLKEEPPDVIYMVSYLKDAVALVKEIRRLKIKSLLAGGAGGFTHPKFIKEAGDSANHVLTATLWYQEMRYPGTKEYYNQYMKRYSIPPDYHAAEAYSALLVAADALKRAKSFSPEDIREALDQTDMNTPFGPVRFSSYDKYERQNSLPTQVLQIVNNKFESIWPMDRATAEFVSPPDWRRGSEKK
jgi:branched-chain amino acid transport system substrate-binding protein